VENALVGLADAIEALRDELIDAMSRGTDRPMQFALHPIELTVQAVITKDARGKIGWQVLEIGGSVEKARTQTLTVRLSPLWKKDDGTLTADFAIASAGLAGDIIGPRTE
jgi:hypothetical protein